MTKTKSVISSQKLELLHILMTEEMPVSCHAIRQMTGIVNIGERKRELEKLGFIIRTTMQKRLNKFGREIKVYHYELMNIADAKQHFINIEKENNDKH
jgi:hypothetical protein